MTNEKFEIHAMVIHLFSKFQNKLRRSHTQASKQCFYSLSDDHFPPISDMGVCRTQSATTLLFVSTGGEWHWLLQQILAHPTSVPRCEFTA